VHLLAFSTALWNTTGILRFDLRFAVGNIPARPGDEQRVAERRHRRDEAKAAARGMADAAFLVYQQWERRQISHAETVDGMKRHLAEVRRLIGVYSSNCKSLTPKPSTLNSRRNEAAPSRGLGLRFQGLGVRV
jgi:hypothetical protein